jgi:hypothetical protein
MRLKPISIKVDGKGAELYNHLLNQPDKPLPKEPTHYVVVDTINRDLSIKRVTIYFSPYDQWDNPEKQWSDDRLKYVGVFIGENLGFLGRDPNTVAYKFWVMEIATNQLIFKSFTYSHCDYD